jgi:predicted DNA-binding transcriptional regulator YafY
MPPSVDALVSAIQKCEVVRLGYARQADGILTLHRVAPLDIRPGETPRTRQKTYLWAYCFEEGRGEMHLLDRILSVTGTEDQFDPGRILQRWPRDRWPVPAAWVVPRTW